MFSYNEDHNYPYLADPEQNRDSCGVGFIASLTNTSSHLLVEKAFEALANLAHRGAIDSDGRTGDGAGVLTLIPKNYYINKAKEDGIDLLVVSDFAVAMIFYPTRENEERACRRIFRATLKKYDIQEVWSREVPVDESVLGRKAASVKPKIYQKFIECPKFLTRDEFEQVLFLMRKEIETLVADQSFDDFYIASMSANTMVHKGLFMGYDLQKFYLDLQDQQFVSPFAIFHQRYSTNTSPSWALAQPFRMMAHNGEINTIRANRNWMYARENANQSSSWVPHEHALHQFIMAGRSDSASFDNALEVYFFSGRSVSQSVVHMVPEAWQNRKEIDPDLRAFYEYHACMAENWGGPAAIAYTDGNVVGTIVDRNGLRPARYKITEDYMIVASEMGCINVPDEEVIENGKLKPGSLIAVNIKRQKILRNSETKILLADQKPYQDWLRCHLVNIEDVLSQKGKNKFEEPVFLDEEQTNLYKKVFGYTQEDIDMILHPMFKNGQEPIGSMGIDTPLAVFSRKPQLLYNYFKQLFAQVTNPPIDPIRERYVMSVAMYLGKSGNIFEQTSQHARQIKVLGPVVTGTVFEAIKNHPDFPSAILATQFPISEGPEGLEDVLLDLCMAAEKAIDRGAILIILSDRFIDKEHAPIPMLLALSAVHHHLIREGKRLNISLLVETGEVRETHHIACLIGYGASVIYPYLALKQAVQYGEDVQNEMTPEEAVKNYLQACEKGILKIMSKMGVSVLQSYHASQIFEAIGLKKSLINQYFTGTQSKISGIGLIDVAKDYLHWHSHAFDLDKNLTLPVGGNYRLRRSGEAHAFSPDMLRYLHRALAEHNFDIYKKYSKIVNERDVMTIRDLLKFKTKESLDIAFVEKREEVIKRFCTPGISYGALSKEAHETFAIAMNRLGAKSNSGEGGEDEKRYVKLPSGDSMNSAIKQVASGRFGVTSYYLSQAREIQIKVAQGAKPGEGGQLLGHKVSVDIAQTRHATPGVTLISPPPHHDIYSIEDLAQLIYDLKMSNPHAKICVKLVSEDGVGTIASGVAKAHADVILISGYDGGTGASPLASIRHAGLPWELGLRETQQILVHNELRERVVLRVDGGLKTGVDVVKAAMMGAEEYGFGTLAMIAVGCRMVRQCHNNTCPVGVATQDKALRAKYRGKPEHVVSLFHFIADEVRYILAELGVQSLEKIIGRTEYLEQILDIDHAKAKKVKLNRLLKQPDSTHFLSHQWERNDWPKHEIFDDHFIGQCKDLLKTGKGNKELQGVIHSQNRSVGARLSYEIVSRYGSQGLPAGTISISLTGTAGQSFGAFTTKSVLLQLEGEANDYVGKGLSGGLIILKPSRRSRFEPSKNIICGNTCLYGATSGKVFIRGRAGERFAVRNSGADAVVEGVGDHGCEYMTGGHVLILGNVGYNFGGGMTGGVACVYDPEWVLPKIYNTKSVELYPMLWDTKDGDVFYKLLKEHFNYTKSRLAECFLDNWEKEKKSFIYVVPRELIEKKGLAERNEK